MKIVIDTRGKIYYISYKIETLNQAKELDVKKKFITVNGETKSISDWAKSLGLSRQCISQRLQNNWDEKDAVSLTKPYSNVRSKYKDLYGKTLSELAYERGLSTPSLCRALKEKKLEDIPIIVTITLDKEQYFRLSALAQFRNETISEVVTQCVWSIL